MHSVNSVSKRFLIVLGLGCLMLLASLALLLWAEPVFSAPPVQEPASLAQMLLSTEVSGIITTDTTWTVEGSPYIVEGNVAVQNGVTLEVEPGVEVRFDGYYYLQVDGKLVSEGTATTPITFTSNLPWPTAGSWGAIRFTDNADDTSVISRTVVMYGEGIYLNRANITTRLHFS